MPRKGQHHSAEAKVKLAKAHLGKKLTDEHRKKISIGGKGRKFTPEHKAKIGAANRGKSRSLEVRLKISEKLKGNKISLGRHHTPETKKKLSEARKGIHVQFTAEHRKNISLSKLREKNPAWNGGISKTGYGCEFKKLKIKIRKRDRFTCYICGKKEKEKAYAVHHIDYDKLNLNQNNLITLYHACHNRTNWRRENWIDYFKKSPRQQGLFL